VNRSRIALFSGLVLLLGAALGGGLYALRGPLASLASEAESPNGGPSAGPLLPPSKPTFFGRIVPRAATPLHAPPNVFRLKGWNSRSNWIKLIDLVPDGSAVKAGDVVGRFEFSNEEARTWLNQRIAETQADLESAAQRVADDSRRERARAEVLGLEAERAELDTQKGTLVSERDLRLLGLAHDRALAEEKSQESLYAATRSRGQSEIGFLQATAEDWKSGILKYEMYEKRVKVLAPHAGVVRHAYINHLRRKVQKADGMPSGSLFLHIAEDERLSVEALVPEAQVAETPVGAKLRVRLPDASERFEATVRLVGDYPQEVGFLRGDDELPDAHEKVYLVTADIDAPPSMKSGMEVRVEP
jgi:hypothetical protein